MTKSPTPSSNQASRIVSSEQELLICVDADDQEVGSATKSECHDGNGKLHRAFSIFIFNTQGRLLLQQRAPGKRLWPTFWSNSCCSHPRLGEELEEAANRRLMEELGLSAPLQLLYKFEYAAQYKNLGTERELCSVFIGTSDAQPEVNANEISDWRWVDQAELTQALAKDASGNEPPCYTPWLQLEWQELLRKYASHLPPTTT